MTDSLLAEPGVRTVRVMLADDHDMVRAGFEALIAQFGGYEVVASVHDGAALVRALEQQPADLVITDIAMPSLGGIDAIALIRRRWPDVRILVVSMDETGHLARRATTHGAGGYLTKAAATLELRLAMDAVMQGRQYLSHRIARQMLATGHSCGIEGLTERQMQVVELLARGKSSKEIAWMLDLSSKTVDAHRKRIMERLGANGLADLTRFALREGLLD